jgi:flagellar protein FliO/FliZ
MPHTGSFLLWFLFVIALIPLALWLLKRSSFAGTGGFGQAGVTRVVATTALGPQQRLVTVEVGTGEARQWLVLGVTAHSITTLHSLPPQELPAPPTAAQGFAALLGKARKEGA